MTDWTTAVAAWGASGLAIVGSAITFGRMTQRVNDLNKRVEKTEAAIEAMGSVSSAVDLLRASTEYSHQAIQAEAKHAAELQAERMQGLKDTVQAFMQGQATGRRRPTRPAPR